MRLVSFVAVLAAVVDASTFSLQTDPVGLCTGQFKQACGKGSKGPFDATEQAHASHINGVVTVRVKELVHLKTHLATAKGLDIFKIKPAHIYGFLAILWPPSLMT